MTSVAQPLLIIDGDNLLVRVERAVQRSGMWLDGVNTGAVKIFIESLARHLRIEQPDSVVVCWDGGRSQWRTDYFPAYKAHRPQTPVDETRPHFLIREFLSYLGVVSAQREGWEADDLIAGYVHRYPEREITILSSDKDLLQLVSPWVTQVKVADYGTMDPTYGPEQVLDKTGCRPEHVPLLMALVGDAVDGVPGVAGIGPVKGLKLLQDADWKWAGVLEQLTPEQREKATQSLRLVDLTTVHPDLPELPEPYPLDLPTGPSHPAWSSVVDYLRRLRLDATLNKLNNGFLW